MTTTPVAYPFVTGQRVRFRVGSPARRSLEGVISRINHATQTALVSWAERGSAPTIIRLADIEPVEPENEAAWPSDGDRSPTVLPVRETPHLKVGPDLGYLDIRTGMRVFGAAPRIPRNS